MSASSSSFFLLLLGGVGSAIVALVFSVVLRCGICLLSAGSSLPLLPVFLIIAFLVWIGDHVGNIKPLSEDERFGELFYSNFCGVVCCSGENG